MATTKVKLPAKENLRKVGMHHTRVLALKAALEVALEATPEQTLEPAAAAAQPYQLIEQVHLVGPTRFHELRTVSWAIAWEPLYMPPRGKPYRICTTLSILAVTLNEGTALRPVGSYRSSCRKNNL